MHHEKFKILVKECVLEVLMKNLSNEGFDPQSQGPNPDNKDNPYPQWNAEMRALEEEEKLNNTRPKKLRDLIHDEWNEGEDGHWVQLRPGWTVDDCVVIHEPTKNKAYARLRDAKFTGLTESDRQNSQPTGETSVDYPINPLPENEHGRYAQLAGAGQFDPRTFGQLRDTYDPDGTKHNLTL